MKEYSSSSLGTFKGEILEKLKNAKYNDLEGIVYRMQLTYDEILDILDVKYIQSKRTRYSLPPGIYNLTDLDTFLKHILPNNVNVSITIDDIRLQSNLKIIKTLIITKMSFLHTLLGFVQSYSGELRDIEGFIQLIPGPFKGDKLF